MAVITITTDIRRIFIQTAVLTRLHHQRQADRDLYALNYKNALSEVEKWYYEYNNMKAERDYRKEVAQSKQ